MNDIFTRTEQLFGAEAMHRLRSAHVAVFGIGGVGGYTAEALVRSGIGSLTIIDNDKVVASNINRQIIALQSCIGKLKVDVAEMRFRDINPQCQITKHAMFYLPENADEINVSEFQFVADCMDTVTAKIELIRRCTENSTPVISAMGAAKRIDPTQLCLTDLSKTEGDPLAKIMRKKLRAIGIKHLPVVCSREQPFTTDAADVLPSYACVPAVAGMIIASKIIRTIALQ